MSTGFWWDERCFWHVQPNYAFTAPVRGWIQPLSGWGSVDNPDIRRRLKNLIDVTGLSRELRVIDGHAATEEELRRVHTTDYLNAFRTLSAAEGGDLGMFGPFGHGGFEIASIAAGLATAGLRSVASGEVMNGYVLPRPPGHHCLRDRSMGFCLLANIAIAIEAAFAEKRVGRVAVVDWDVHPGNGTEAIFYERSDVLTISLHQENSLGPQLGLPSSRGSGIGTGYNVNVPLTPGAGHAAYLYAMNRIVIPLLERYRPDIIVVASGYDAAIVDPMSRMNAVAATYSEMTKLVMSAADELCGGRLLCVHEGGYSEFYLPFCGHAVLTALSGSGIEAADPCAERFIERQPGERFDAFQRLLLDDYSRQLGLALL